MCGRFSLRSGIETIVEEFTVEVVSIKNYSSSFNISPGDDIATVTRLEQKNQLAQYRWGLIPSWSAAPPKPIINARADTLLKKPSFKRSFRYRRCIIAADGFYEWKEEGREKVPYYIHMKEDRPFGMAGIYDTWRSKGEEVKSCAIITTDANEVVSPIHDRMPAIIPREMYDTWLDGEVEVGKLMGILKPYRGEDLEAYQVSKRVNSSFYNSKDLIRPYRGYF